MPENNGNERPSYGYTTESGERVSALRDRFNGGGPGRSGPRFEGGGIISDIGNAMGGPSMFGGGGGDGGGGNRGATIGRIAGGMMFGPLGMIGGGLLGNMLGGGMRRGLAQGVSQVPTQAPRPAGVPAPLAMAPMRSPAPAMRPTTPGNVPLSAQPGFFAPPQVMPPIIGMPGAVERFMAQYGGMPTVQAGYTPPALPGAVPMSNGVTMPSIDPMSSPMVGYMPRASMPMDPMMDPRNMVSLPIDPMTGRPMAMMPPRLQ